MKKYLIHKLPWLYFAARFLYRLTPIYKIKTRERERADAVRRQQIEERARVLMNDVFGGDYRVVNGPFKGMKYVDSALGSSLLPKILGSYEEPIQEWVEAAIAKSYDRILVIGCAEGYYAVGFALRSPATEIIAYDINRTALDLCREMAAINGVDNVAFKQSCDFQELDDQIAGRTLIFCDIEGGERELLDPACVEELFSADMIIESHDSYLPGMTEMLVKRFRETHRITIAMDYPTRLNPYRTPAPVSADNFADIIDENRVPFMKFLYCKSLRGTHPDRSSR